MAIEGPGAEHTRYTTPMSRVGIEGLQLNKPLDQLSLLELQRMSNWVHTGSDLTSRPGEVLLCTGNAGIPMHSVKRLNDPRNGTYTRFWGAGGQLGRGTSGGLSAIDAGFSGDPLTFAPARPPQSGEPWMIIADRSRIRKASRTSASLPVGLPAPATPAVVVNAGKRRNLIAFDASDGTQAAAWTAIGGYDFGSPVGQATQPIVSDIPGVLTNGVNMATQPGTTTTAYLSMIALAKVLDGSTFSGGGAVSDEDIVHLYLRMDSPASVEEIRLYFVVSPFTTGTPLPAIPGTAPPFNTAAYVHTYRPSDYAAYIANTLTAEQTAAVVRNSTLLEGYTATPLASQSDVGANQWTEFGIIGLPVRRGDFLPIGSAGSAGTDWSTITGIYIVVQNKTGTFVNAAFDDLYITGGYGPDTSEPGSSQLDFRITNTDPRTGAESNGSTTMAEANFVDALRQSITITPAAAFGDAAVRQNFYQRGGVNIENWSYIGQNAGDGLPFTATAADSAIDTSGASTLPTDHFQPVATVDSDGTTILAQPIPVIFGPFDDGTYCGLGDPYRPGYCYASLPNEPDHWPSTGAYAIEVTPPSEPLMNGAVIGGQGFVLSRERGYAVHANVAGGEGIVCQPTNCTPGLAVRWGMAVGPGGLYYVARDGIRVTAGQDSKILSDAIRPLFQWDPGGSTAAVATCGFLPIDWAADTAIHLEVHNLDLWFLYQDSGGTRRCLIYSLIYNYWRPYTFAKVPSCLQGDPTFGGLRLVIGATDGNGYTHEGYADDGTAITVSGRTGTWDFGQPHEEKLLGEVVLHGDLQTATLTIQTYLNDELTTNPSQTTVGVAGMRRYLFEPFGTNPQHARNVSIDFSLAAPTTGVVILRQLGISYVTEPEITMNRATTWETLNASGEAYVTGCWIDCDTGGSARTIAVEGLLAGTLVAIATLTVTSNAGRRLWFSWPAVHADQIRLRPTGNCEPWMLFAQGWIASAEPARVAKWDTNWEAAGDAYYTGFDVEVDTFNMAKTLQVWVDQTLIDTKTVQANGRTLLHFTVTPGRGHLFRLVATDSNPGLFYAHKWWAIPEPTEQANWNAPYTVWSSLSDKYLKGLVIEADTFGAAKAVNVEADGAVVVTGIAVTHSGRTVRNYTFPQVLGRVFRVIPTDTNPSRIYSIQPLFDEEPFALDRWESQLRDFDLPGAGWGSLISADVCLKSTAAVTWTVLVYNAAGTLMATLVHTLASTGGLKQKLFVPAAAAHKGVLFKSIFTSGSPLTLYREESRIRVAPWGAPEQAVTRPFFGNDDLDPTRGMVGAISAASRSGGSA